eukprot:GHVU01071017.1.p2 GENE.GHVU01071017.1~~GHVU01071017.1.p2  ORF type:complete len:134 (+),score=0.36 GHVU01071017.1:1244-1645(+)
MYISIAMYIAIYTDMYDACATDLSSGCISARAVALMGLSGVAHAPADGGSVTLTSWSVKVARERETSLDASNICGRTVATAGRGCVAAPLPTRFMFLKREVQRETAPSRERKEVRDKTTNDSLLNRTQAGTWP